jgi:hypothetical protein
MKQLRVNTAALQTTVARWSASVGELTENEVPAVTGTARQPSALAVRAAHVGVILFTAELASRIDLRAQHVADANTNFVANEIRSADHLAALTHSPAVV